MKRMALFLVVAFVFIAQMTAQTEDPQRVAFRYVNANEKVVTGISWSVLSEWADLSGIMQDKTLSAAIPERYTPLVRSIVEMDNKMGIDFEGTAVTAFGETAKVGFSLNGQMGDGVRIYIPLNNANNFRKLLKRLDMKVVASKTKTQERGNYYYSLEKYSPYLLYFNNEIACLEDFYDEFGNEIEEKFRDAAYIQNVEDKIAELERAWALNDFGSRPGVSEFFSLAPGIKSHNMPNSSFFSAIIPTPSLSDSPALERLYANNRGLFLERAAIGDESELLAHQQADMLPNRVDAEMLTRFPGTPTLLVFTNLKSYKEEKLRQKFSGCDSTLREKYVDFCLNLPMVESLNSTLFRCEGEKVVEFVDLLEAMFQNLNDSTCSLYSNPEWGLEYSHFGSRHYSIVSGWEVYTLTDTVELTRPYEIWSDGDEEEKEAWENDENYVSPHEGENVTEIAYISMTNILYKDGLMFVSYRDTQNLAESLMPQEPDELKQRAAAHCEDPFYLASIVEDMSLGDELLMENGNLAEIEGKCTGTTYTLSVNTKEFEENVVSLILKQLLRAREYNYYNSYEGNKGKHRKGDKRRKDVFEATDETPVESIDWMDTRIRNVEEK